MIDLPKIEAAIEPLLDQEAVELVDLKVVTEGGRRILRFFLDKAGGIKLDDCEYMSNRIGAFLDSAELVAGRYVLEVSSPGLDRVLKKERDYLRFVGHRAKVRLKAAAAGQRNFRGYLRPMEGSLVVLESGEHTMKVELGQIEEARLDPEIDI